MSEPRPPAPGHADPPAAADLWLRLAEALLRIDLLEERLAELEGRRDG